MPDNTVAVLEARLAKLEARERRQRQRLAVAAGAMAVMAISAWTTAAQQPRTIDERVTDLEKRVIGAGGISEAMKIRAPFEVVDKTGATIMRMSADANDGKPLLEVSRDNVGVAMGVGASDNGFVVVQTAERRPGALIGRFGAGGRFGLHVLGPDGKTAQGELVRDEKGDGRLRVGAANGGGVLAGVGESGIGGLSVFEENGRPVAAVGMLQGTMGFRLFHEYPGRPAAGMLFGDDGGQLRVFDKKGTAVAVVGVNPTGGRVQIASSATGQSTANLVVSQDGGRLVLFPISAENARVSLSASGADGSLVLYDKAGVAEVSLSAGDTAGLLELSQNGSRMVQAGTQEGAGIVRTGPGIRAGGMLAPGSYIKGKAAQ